ncbi:MFS transporter [Armatimonas sp.]|uniref:MFS transporter n=1 Tax=Armatimonas sp. TaxID=1872638 RepID=UPI00286CBA80|nr:MFS transporter [Armatimonas sp.]
MTRRDKQINFLICLADAVGFPLGIAFFSTQTILPAFLDRCGATPGTIGALTGLSSLLILGPGLLTVGVLQRLKHVRLWLFWVALIERLFLLPLAFLAPLWGKTQPDWLIIATFVGFCGHSLAMGFNIPAYWTAIGKTIPVHWRGRLYGFAGGIAGVCTLGTEWVLRHVVLGRGFPGGYGLGFGLGFVILTITIIPFLFLREPDGRVQESGLEAEVDKKLDAAMMLNTWRGDAPFRRLGYSQVVFALTQVAAPFLALFAARRFGEAQADLALYTAVSIFAGSVAALLIGWLADRWGNRPMVLLACVAAAAGFIFALLAPTGSWFAGVFVLWALATAGVDLAASNLMMELAGHPSRIPLYSALYNIIRAAPRMIAPWLGGLAVAWIGYGPLMGIAAGAALLSLALLLRSDSRVVATE